MNTTGDDRDFFPRILHGLYHVFCDTPQFFQRVTPIDKIVFEALINSIHAHGGTKGRHKDLHSDQQVSFAAKRLLRAPLGSPMTSKPRFAGLGFLLPICCQKFGHFGAFLCFLLHLPAYCSSRANRLFTGIWSFNRGATLTGFEPVLPP
jgi:hypothetical protein